MSPPRGWARLRALRRESHQRSRDPGRSQSPERTEPELTEPFPEPYPEKSPEPSSFPHGGGGAPERWGGAVFGGGPGWRSDGDDGDAEEVSASVAHTSKGSVCSKGGLADQISGLSVRDFRR